MNSNQPRYIIAIKPIAKNEWYTNTEQIYNYLTNMNELSTSFPIGKYNRLSINNGFLHPSPFWNANPGTLWIIHNRIFITQMSQMDIVTVCHGDNLGTVILLK